MHCSASLEQKKIKWGRCSAGSVPSQCSLADRLTDRLVVRVCDCSVLFHQREEDDRVRTQLLPVCSL
ncbi:hypothetical protein DPEC_G00144950 [Dallia pectoralis]|uniref:Uncharacterized protein n=1 Tax=Dallia pectoralis TaxID=75939 RepID=A0ACC2GNQ1_DALPE|nr:hypothetical protein DPEC_G00144950 [Dallia pectoralis]